MTSLRFSEEHYGASLILGGAEGTLWDISGMYASLSRVLTHYRPYNGRYNPQDIHPLTPFPNKEKEPIQSITDKRLTDKPLLSAASIWFTYKAMSALNRPEEEADWQQFESMKQIAWRTRCLGYRDYSPLCRRRMGGKCVWRRSPGPDRSRKCSPCPLRPLLTVTRQQLVRYALRRTGTGGDLS